MADINKFSLGKNGKFGEIDFSKIKSGLKESDLVKNNAYLKSIFDRLDKNGDGQLDREELNALQKLIAKLSGDENLSLSEARKCEDKDGKIGYKGAKLLMEFLSNMSEVAKSQGVKNVETLAGGGGLEVVTYEDGHTEEIHPDGSVVITVTDGKSTTRTHKDKDGNILEETVTEDNVETKTNYENGKKVKTVQTKKDSIETINYDSDGNPEKKIIKEQNSGIESHYKYENNQFVLKKKIDSSNNAETVYSGTKETTTQTDDDTKNVTIRENGEVVRTTKTKKTENNEAEITDTIYSGDDFTENYYLGESLRRQKKSINGREYQVTYDKDGNTEGVIVQNGENLAMIAKHFGCSVQDLIKVNASKIHGKYPNAYFVVGEEIKIPKMMYADEYATAQEGRKDAAGALEDASKARQAKIGKEIARGANGYYVTQSSDGKIRFWNSKKKEISGEDFQKACPKIYKDVTEAQRGATKRTRQKYDTATIQKGANELATKIHDQISGASLNANTINMLRGITYENAAFVVSEYQKMYGVSLAKDIDDEWGLDINTVKEHICKKLVEQAKILGIPDVYHANYAKINDLATLQTWIDDVSSKIINTMNNAKETYYATDSEEVQRNKNVESAKTVKDSASQIAEDLINNAKGLNNVNKIKAIVARIDSPEELQEVNRLLTLKGYPPTDKYSPIENFIYQEANHSIVHTYNSSDYLEQTVQEWIDNGTLKGQEANEAQARMAARVLYDGGDGFGTDCEKIKKAVRMIKCPKPTGDKAADNKQAREVYRLVNAMIKKHNTFYGLGSSCKNLIDYCEGEMWDSEVKYLKGILAETNAIQGEEKAQAVKDLTQQAVEGAGTNIEELEQAIKGINSPEDRRAVEAKLEEYCRKKGIKTQIEGQSYLQAILYDECDTFMGISRDHKEIRKFNEMLIAQGAYTDVEIVNLRAEQAALQILEGDFSNIKDAIEQLKDPKVLAKVEQLLTTKGYKSLDEFLSLKLNQTKTDVVKAELASNNLLPDEQAATVACRLIKNTNFNNIAQGLRAIRNESVAKMVDEQLQQEGSSLAEVMEQFNKDKDSYKFKAKLWGGLSRFIFGNLVGFFTNELSSAYRKNTDSSDNMFVKMESGQELSEEQKQSYQMTVQIMEQKLAQMEKDYQAALDTQGAVSWAINKFCEQYGIETTRKGIEARIEHDKETIRLLKLAADGELGKMENGKAVAVTFEEVFNERNIGTAFDVEKVAKVQQQAEMLSAMDYAKTNIAVCWEELENGLKSSDLKRLTVAIVDTLEKLSNVTGRNLSLDNYGYSVKDSIIIDSNGKPVSVDKLCELANQLKQGLSDIAKDLLGAEIPLNTSSSHVSKLLEKPYNNKKESFKQEFKDAFGQDCPDEMVEKYVSTINTGKTIVNMGVLIGAVIAAPFTGGGSLAVFTAGAGASLGLSALEHSTDANGWTNAEWTSDAEQAMWDGLLSALGMKVGTIADAKAIGVYKTAAQNMLKKYVPNIAEKTLDRASVCIARVRAMGYEVTSDTVQSIAQMYCQDGEFNEEAFVRDLLLSVAGNAAGHIANGIGDVKSRNTKVDAPNTNESSKISEKVENSKSAEISKAEQKADVETEQNSQAVHKKQAEGSAETTKSESVGDAGKTENATKARFSADELKQKLGKRLYRSYKAIENAIEKMKNAVDFDKIYKHINDKFNNYADVANELIDKLKAKAKQLGLKIEKYFDDIKTTRTQQAGKIRPELDKYTRSKKGIDMNKSHEDWMKSRKDLFDDVIPYYQSCWAQYTPKDKHHGAWKMHLFSVSEADWREMCDVIIPYLKEHDIEWKTFNDRSGVHNINGSKQEGKAFTIYPKSNEDMAQIAKDLDYIIRKNKLETSGSHITGDNQMGNTGRLFYRYEFNSGAYKDEILDLSNKADINKYHARYDANRGEGKYLADDMSVEDDIWRNFDPSDSKSQPSASGQGTGTSYKKGQTNVNEYEFSNLYELRQKMADKLNLFSQNTQNRILQDLANKGQCRLQKNGVEYQFTAKNGHLKLEEFDINAKYNIQSNRIDDYTVQKTFDIEHPDDLYWALSEELNLFSTNSQNTILERLSKGQNCVLQKYGMRFEFKIDSNGRITVTEFEYDRFQKANAQQNTNRNAGAADNSQRYRNMSPEKRTQIDDLRNKIEETRTTINALEVQIQNIRTKFRLPENTVREYKALLGIPDNVQVTERVLKRAYNQKAMELHPDKGGSKEAFQKIQEANEALKKHYGFADTKTKIESEIAEIRNVIEENKKALAEYEAKINKLMSET